MITIGLVDRLVKSEVDRGLDHDSDHLPISTVLDLTVQQLERTTKKDWRKLNEKAYRRAFKNTLLPP